MRGRACSGYPRTGGASVAAESTCRHRADRRREQRSSSSRESLGAPASGCPTEDMDALDQASAWE